MSGYRPDGLEDAFTTDGAERTGATTDDAVTDRDAVTDTDAMSEVTAMSAGASEDVQVPRIGVVGWLRWVWRQLSSMRVALMLLMLLAAYMASKAI